MLSSKRPRYGKGCNSDGENHHEVDDGCNDDDDDVKGVHVIRRVKILVMFLLDEHE